jgi:DNA-binding GntR family transcriptional regulator
MALNLEHKPLKEEIYEALHRQIIAGKYSPGDWLRQEDIATQMGVSMTPVREALDLLVASGVAERVPYRGVRVREMAVNDIVEAYGMRIIFEVLIAREAAKNITRAQIIELEKMLADMQGHHSLNEMPHVRELSRDFHIKIAKATNNDLLVKMYEIVSNAFPDWMLYEAVFRIPGLLEDSMDNMNKEHAAILDALKKQDGEKAAQKSILHLMESGKWLKKYLNIPAELLRDKEEQVSFLIRSAKSPDFATNVGRRSTPKK